MKKLISLMLVMLLLIMLCPLSMAAENNSNDSEKEETKEEAKEEIKLINTGIDPLLAIEDIEVDKEVAIGKEFTVKILVRNIGTGTAFFPKIEFKEPDETSGLPHFEIVNSLGDSNNVFDANIKEFRSGEVKSFTVKMRVKENAPQKTYRINVRLFCQNAHLNANQTFDTNSNFTITTQYSLTKPLFVIKSVQFEPKEPDLTQPFKMTLFFENISDSNAGNVSVSIDGLIGEKTKNFTVLDLTNTQHLFEVKGKQTRMAAFNLEAEELREGNELKVKFKYTYEGKDETQEEIINLPLPDPDSGVGKKPRVIINKYTLSDEKVLAGNTVILQLFIENTNIKAVNNVKISLEVPKNEDNAIGGTVFSPVDSSNTFFIDKIPGKTIVTKEIPLYVDPNAQAKTHIVMARIEYEDEKGAEFSAAESLNIPVTQECRFEVLSVDVPPSAFVGQPVPIAAEFVNVGKVALTNFIVNLEGDFQKENSLYYIGTLDTGMSDYYQAMAIPQSEGELTGAIVFTYIDNNNKEVRVEEPFTVQVQAPMPIEGDMEPGGFEGKPGMPMGPDRAMGGGLGQKLKDNWKAMVLLVIVLIQGVFIWRLKRKVKANGEFFDV
ncbi:MAG: hypothetical protein GXW85_01310 [Clostridia bacterium]|nr:hypothetical protein [Clostridia bacterium]